MQQQQVHLVGYFDSESDNSITDTCQGNYNYHLLTTEVQLACFPAPSFSFVA